MSEDVRVLGMVAGIHVIEDIGVSVPHGVTVPISADQAGMSKDLWRAVGQKKLFQWPQGTAPQHVAPNGHVRDDVLQERNRFLEERVRQLEEENRQLRATLDAALAQQDRLDRILGALEGGGRGPAPAHRHTNGQAATAEVADGAVPQFIPSEIAPKDASARIDLIKQEGTDTDALDAKAALRKLRRADG